MCRLRLVRVGPRVISLRHLILYEDATALRQPASPNVAGRATLEEGVVLELTRAEADRLSAAIDEAIAESTPALPAIPDPPGLGVPIPVDTGGSLSVTGANGGEAAGSAGAS